MRFYILAFAFAFLAASPVGVTAATVSPTTGEVRVGTGQGFQRISVPTEVSAGAQVMVGPGGAASIAYTDNCVVPAPAAAITVVESRAPCARFPAPSYFGFAPSTEAGWDAQVDAPLGFTPKVDAPDPVVRRPQPQPSNDPQPARAGSKSGHGTEFLIVGGVVVGAGALAAVLLTQGDDDPASP